MNVKTLTERAVEVFRVTSPLEPDLAWEIEAFLLKIFEYFNYSLRSALLGKYSRSLACTCFAAKRKGKIIAAAVCLCSRSNPRICLLGPVGVAKENRRHGIATALINNAMHYLRDKGTKAVYLGINDNMKISNLYSKLGFERYKGIVWRRLFCSKDEFEKDYFGKSGYIKIRRVTWADFPGISALACFPAEMYSFDAARDILSSRYVEPEKFLPVFPKMMSDFAKWGGLANVLVAGRAENIVGLAQIRALPAQACRHIAEFDFYLHDNFIELAELLVRVTLIHSASLSLSQINFYCLACDNLKRKVITKLGAREIAVLPESVQIRGRLEDVLIYHLARSSNANGQT